MIAALDDAVGRTLAALRESGAEQNTLIFFMSDNGGPYISDPPFTSNAPLRGCKGQVYEGGIHVPFLVSWPARLAQGKKYDRPVIQLDLFPTALAAAGAAAPAGVTFDGVDLLPFLSGERSEAPHERLFWRTGGGDQFAVRQGDWKWVKRKNQPPELYNLASDIGEAKDVIADNPAVAAALEKASADWNKELIPPLFQSPVPAGKKKAQKGKAKAKGKKA